MSEDARDTATCGDSLLPKRNSTELQDVTAGLDDVEDEKKALASPGAKVEVKFVSPDSQNGDAILDIENVRAAFSGMGKEELMKFANDPFWVRTRWVLFVGFWVLWVAMVAGAVAIIILAPKCAPPKPRSWWEQSPLYSVDALSSDGANDLRKVEGIERYLTRLSKIGADGIILPSVLNTGSSNNPEAVVDFKDIKADIGSLADFKRALAEVKKNGGHVIMDIAPGHTSIEHEWFKKSVEKDDLYKYYYIWVNSTVKDNFSPLSQWGEDWNGGSFVWNDKRAAFYLKQTSDGLPVLNFTNPAVLAEMQDVLRFWLDAGVSGFQIRHASNLIASDRLRLPKGSLLSRNVTSRGVSIIQELHNTVTNHTNDNVLILEGDVHSAYQDKIITGLSDVLSTPIPLLTLQEGFTAQQLKDKVQGPINESASKWPLWDISESQVKATRIPPSLLDGLFMTVLVLPGTPVVHRGSLLDISAVSTAPTGTVSTGVEIAKTASQKRADIYKELASVRKSMDAFHFGRSNVTIVNGTEGVDVFTLTRIKAGTPGILVVLNPTNTNTSVNLSGLDKVPEELTVHSLSLASGGDSQLQPKSKLSSTEIKLPGRSTIIFTFVPKKGD